MALPQDFYDDDTGSPLPQQQYGDSEQSGPPGPAGPAGPAGASGGVFSIDTAAAPGPGYAIAQTPGGPALTGELAFNDGGLEHATVLGIYDGTAGKIRQSGDLVNQVKMTTDGGLPAIGDPVFLAAHADDGNTGDGKLTATPPQGNGQAVVPVGICVDNASYAGSKTCKICIWIQTPHIVYPTGVPVTGGG